MGGRGRQSLYLLHAEQHHVGCAVQKAVKLLGELEKYGLIERVRQGQGRPSRIYVKNFLPPLRNSKNKDFENHSSETSKTKVQGLRIPKANNTEKNYTDAVPAYLCIIAMPLFYSISEGIALGVISYVVINLVCGKSKNINPIMYVVLIIKVLL